MTMAPQQSAEQRKKFLIVQGQVFRLGMLQAQQALEANLRRDVLIKSAVTHLVSSSTEAARQVFTLDGLSRAVANGRVALALPVLTKLLGFLSRRHLLMPAGIAVAVGAAGLISWRKVREKKRRRQALFLQADAEGVPAASSQDAPPD